MNNFKLIFLIVTLIPVVAWSQNDSLNEIDSTILEINQLIHKQTSDPLSRTVRVSDSTLRKFLNSNPSFNELFSVDTVNTHLPAISYSMLDTVVTRLIYTSGSIIENHRSVYYFNNGNLLKIEFLSQKYMEPRAMSSCHGMINYSSSTYYQNTTSFRTVDQRAPCINSVLDGINGIGFQNGIPYPTERLNMMLRFIYQLEVFTTE